MGSVTPLVAFAAGVVSFFSPCIVPVVPGYLAFITRGATTRARRLGTTTLFVLGFGIAFVILGALIGGAASFGATRVGEVVARRIGGALIIGFGLVMTGLIRLPFLDRDVRYHGTEGSAFLLGAAFGVGWSPCVGPILASILILAGVTGGASAGAALLAVYALGLAVPFLLLGFFATPLAEWLRRHARATRVVEVVGGVILIVLGIAVFTGAITRAVSYLV